MEIKKGIMLFNECDEAYSNITINSGVVPYKQQEIPKVEYGEYSFYPLYEEDARLPKRNWRSLTQKEISTLKPTEKRTDTNTIYTGRLPDDVIELIEQLNLKQCTNRSDVFDQFQAQPAITDQINKKMEVFLNARANGKPHKIHYLGTNLPNMEVVACDTTVMPKGYKEEEKKYLGIHNDGTYYIPFRSIRNSGNRFTVNLGKETRYFLFINLTMLQAYNLIKKHFDLGESKIDVINISHFFFKCFPDYPVLRIAQKPYDYYVAPTDNCFHDGCTLGNKELDIVLAYLGAFRY